MIETKDEAVSWNELFESAVALHGSDFLVVVGVAGGKGRILLVRLTPTDGEPLEQVEDHIPALLEDVPALMREPQTPRVEPHSGVG